MDHEPKPETAETTQGFFRWELVVLIMGGLLLLLAFQLWRKLDNVDPLRNCAGKYDNVHTAVDTSLVDGIVVRWPDRETKTTCGALRRAGELQNVPRPRPTGGGIMPPPPTGEPRR